MKITKSDLNRTVYFVSFKIGNNAAPITVRAWIKDIKKGVASIEYSGCEFGVNEMLIAHLERPDWNRVIPAY